MSMMVRKPTLGSIFKVTKEGNDQRMRYQQSLYTALSYQPHGYDWSNQCALYPLYQAQ